MQFCYSTISFGKIFFGRLSVNHERRLNECLQLPNAFSYAASELNKSERSERTIDRLPASASVRQHFGNDFASLDSQYRLRRRSNEIGRVIVIANANNDC